MSYSFLALGLSLKGGALLFFLLSAVFYRSSPEGDDVGTENSVPVESHDTITSDVSDTPEVDNPDAVNTLERKTPEVESRNAVNTLQRESPEVESRNAVNTLQREAPEVENHDRYINVHM